MRWRTFAITAIVGLASLGFAAPARATDAKPVKQATELIYFNVQSYGSDGQYTNCMSVKDRNPSNGAKIILWDCLYEGPDLHTPQAQQWQFENHPNVTGYHQLRDGYGRCLSLKDSIRPTAPS